MEISLRAISVQRGDKWALRDITWTAKPGERWALIGDNGAGKTQLLKLLCADVWPTPGAANCARLYKVGSRVLDLIEAKRRVAYVGAEQQDKYARYQWNLKVRDIIATGIHRTDILLGPVTAAQRTRVNAMLRACDLHGLAGREFLTLSYGQKRLVLLARALAQKPDWLLLDEFYNGLDGDYRRRIDKVLDAASRRGQSWVATAHRAMDVPRGTRRMLELAKGSVRAIKPLRAPDLARLVDRAGEAPAVRPRTGMSVGARPSRGPAARGGAAPSTGGAVLVRIVDADLFVAYRSVLRRVNWQLRRGEHWAVYGANGAGKSTFLKLLYGDLSPALGGSIERRGFPRGTPIADWKRQVGFVSPELQTLYANDTTLLELVASGRYASIGLVDTITAQDQRVATQWLKFFGLQSLAKRRPRQVSYGQLRRALIARAMAANPRILLLDEPLTGLDPTQRNILRRLLEQLMAAQVTLIVAVHHPEDLPRGMTHGLRLDEHRAAAVDAYFATQVGGR